MKKLLASCGLALALLAGSQQPASAWGCCFRFSIGLSFDCSCGGNCCLGGLWCNGPGTGAGYAWDQPMAAWYAPTTAGYHAPGYAPPTPMAGYPAPYYQPQAYYPYAGYAAAYPGNYYPMSYSYGWGGMSFYGN